MEEENNDHIGAHYWGGFTEAFLLCADHEDEASKISSLKKLKVLAECKTLKEIREALGGISKTERDYLNSPLLDEIFDTIVHSQEHSPVVECATKNKKEALKFYLKRGDYTKDLNHAICRASAHGHTEIIKILMKIDIEKDDYFLKWSAAGGHTETILFFLGYFEYSIEEKNIALRYALRNEHFDTIKLLLEVGADPHSLLAENAEENPEYLTPYSPLKSSDVKIVELFMQHGVSPFENENSAIIGAAMRGYTDVIKLFLKNKYFPVDINIDNCVILRNATEYNHTDLVEFLLENSADVNSVNLDRFTYHKKLDEKILESFIKHGANIRAEDDALLISMCSSHIDTAGYIESLLKHGANVKTQNNRPLRTAFVQNRLDLVKVLVKYGADINDVDDGVKNLYFYEEYLRTLK